MNVVTGTRHGKYSEDTERFQFAMPKELKARLRKRADTEGTTIAEILREGAEWYLSQPLPKG